MKIVSSKSPTAGDKVLNGYIIHERTLDAYSKMLLTAKAFNVTVPIGFLLIADALDGTIFFKLSSAALVLCLTLVAIFRVDRVERTVGKLVYRPYARQGVGIRHWEFVTPQNRVTAA